MIEQLFIRILNMSLTGGITILCVLAVRLILRRVPRIFSYCLWVVVLFRLLCPISFSAAFSLFGTFKSVPVEQGRITYISGENLYLSGMQDGQMGVKVDEEESLPVQGMANTGTAERVLGQSETVGTLLTGAGYIWLAGIMVMAGYSIISLVQLKKKVYGAKRENGNVYLSDLTTPFVIGFFVPRIYLPSFLTAREKEYILLHEQVHIRRGDHILKIIAYLALCLHWFNPLVWGAFFLSGKDMEMSCDEAVLRKIGNDVKKEYSASLLSLATGRRIVGGVPLAFGEGDTGSRIKNVLHYKKPAVIGMIAGLLICVAVGVVLVANPNKKAEEAVGTEAGVSDEKKITEDNGTLTDAGVLDDERTVEGADSSEDILFVNIRHIDTSERAIDVYTASEVSSYEGGEPLVFAENCVYRINYGMDTLEYEEVSFDNFAKTINDGEAHLKVPVLNQSCTLTVKDGQVVEADLHSAYYAYGISYAEVSTCGWWYEGILEMEGEDVMERCYTLADTVQADISEHEGEETIEVYTGNIGDGDSAVVLYKAADGTLLFYDGAHSARMGWNNIYLGKTQGTEFIMNVYIEDRWDYGGYMYMVYRLDENGGIEQIAGSDFVFELPREGDFESDGVSLIYDDTVFQEWAKGLEYYLNNSYLILSIQEGEIRTEHVSDADRYCYETLNKSEW